MRSCLSVLVLATALAGCSSLESQQKLATSWASAAGMVTSEWLSDRVPEAYCGDTLSAARDALAQLTAEVGTANYSEDARRQSALARLQSIRDAIEGARNAVEHSDRAAAKEALNRLT